MDRLVLKERDLSPLDERLARDCLVCLHAHYPEWNWIVAVPPGQNIVAVKNADLAPRTPWGYVIHKTDLYGDPSLKAVVKAGGEILERYLTPRKGYREGVIDLVIQPFVKPDV